MKDKIFLIWSGNIDGALKVKRILEDEYNYLCYIGGNYDNNSSFASIGDTVIQQMKTCNQAIVFFQNKDNGSVSNNLFFELGYVFAKCGMKKVHCVKKKDDHIILPSDFDNSFIEEIISDDDNEYASNVTKYFLSRQRLSIDQNKMYLINNRYVMHDMIQAHYSAVGSRCSDYELAQYVLFYMQASVMFQDEAKIFEELKDFKRLHGNEFSLELSMSVNLSISFLAVQINLINDRDIVYLSDETYRNYSNSCQDLLDDINDDDTGSYDEWAKAFISQQLAYIINLYAFNPIHSPEFKSYLFKKSIGYGEKCVKYISVLEKNTPCIENNDNVGLVGLLKAYVYRHLYAANLDTDAVVAEKWLKASIKARKSLIRVFDNNSIDSKIYHNFKMEYYLNLTEYLSFYDKESVDKFEYKMYLEEIDSFITNSSSGEKINVYIKKIVNQRNVLSEN